MSSELRVLHLMDGDEMVINYTGELPHFLEVPGNNWECHIHVDRVFMLTPTAYKSLQRKVSLLNILERWTVTEARILLRKLRPKAKR